jgi:hypothetical protein
MTAAATRSPTDRLYPFQWNWDSAFVAMGWATFDKERAWRELERLVEGQWDDGMVPHIVFHAPSDDYFPGPDVWRTRHAIPTSGITQPPVFATALRRVFEIARGPDAQARAARLYRCALASHDWWEKARDPEATGLVAILHPWESGMDNSPAWDEAMARLTIAPTTPIRAPRHLAYRRRDAPARRGLSPLHRAGRPLCGARLGARGDVAGLALQARRRRDECDPAQGGRGSAGAGRAVRHRSGAPPHRSADGAPGRGLLPALE